MSAEQNQLESYGYREADPPYWSGDESGYDLYHRQLYRLTANTPPFSRWKIRSTGMNVARQLAGARNRGRAAWEREHGSAPAEWSLPHPPAVLWFPTSAWAACLGCMWIDGSSTELGGCAGNARRHAASFLPAGSPAMALLLDPLPVWKHPGTGGERAPKSAG